MNIFWFIITFLTVCRFALKLERKKIDLLSLFTLCYMIFII